MVNLGYALVPEPRGAAIVLDSWSTKSMKTLILAAAALVALTFGANAQAVKLGTEGAYPPYNYVDDSGNVGGFDIDVGNELCTRAALTCEWVVNEWDTIIPNLIAGNYDAIIADMSITDERKQTIDFTDNYFPPDPSTFVSAAGTTYDYEALKGLKIGAQSSTIQAGYLNDKLKADNTILTYDTQDQELADLNAGNLDLVFIDGSVAGEIAAGSNGALKIDGPDILLGNGAGIGLRKADTELKDKLNTALAAMKADGTLDALIIKYFPEMAPGPIFKQ
jgi:polar amino acid transport system substrate-binding protein